MSASTPVTRDRVANQAFAVSFEGLGRVFTAGNGEFRPVLRHLSLDIEPREIRAILGTSGCGKSTLLRIVAGLVPHRCRVGFRHGTRDTYGYH